jgi:holo-[acyl-carrier protein] synthase
LFPPGQVAKMKGVIVYSLPRRIIVSRKRLIMRIHGIGTHIVECIQLRRMIEQHGENFLNFVFTEKEIRFCQSRRAATEWFSSFWAAKEAILQCLGIGAARDQRWLEMEIDSPAGGGYSVQLSGGCRDRMQERNINEFQIAMSFSRAYATAFVIASNV